MLPPALQDATQVLVPQLVEQLDLGRCIFEIEEVVLIGTDEHAQRLGILWCLAHSSDAREWNDELPRYTWLSFDRVKEYEAHAFGRDVQLSCVLVSACSKDARRTCLTRPHGGYQSQCLLAWRSCAERTRTSDELLVESKDLSELSLLGVSLW